MRKLTVARALMARVGQKAINLFTIIAIIVVCVLLLITVALVYFFSPWWWLLILPAIVLFAVFLLFRVIASLIIRRIHTEQMNTRQKEAIDSFVEKIQALLEARATPPWIFVMITLKDIIIHRDITTIKKLIKDSTSLRHDYAELEKLF